MPARAKVVMLEAKMRKKPYAFDAGREVPELEIDPETALRLIADHERAKAPGTSVIGRPRKAGRTPRVASNAEVEAALIKRLAAYSRRVRGCPVPLEASRVD